MRWLYDKRKSVKFRIIRVLLRLTYHLHHNSMQQLHLPIAKILQTKKVSKNNSCNKV